MKQLSIANQPYLSRVKPYFVAFVALGFAVGLRVLLNPVLGQGYPFLTIFIAVVFSSWYCCLGPSIAVAAAGLLYAWYDFIPPAHSFALTDPAAQIGGMVGFCINAGAVIAYAEVSRRARNEAKASSEALRLAQQVARVGSFEWNIKTGAIEWTPELETIYGLKPGSFGGTFADWEQLVFADDLQEAKRRVEKSLQKGVFEGEWRVVWPDGSLHWVLGRGYVFKDEAGTPVRMLGVNIDISERKQSEKANSLLAAIVDSSDDAIVSKTLDGIITSWNKSANRILGYAPEEAIGQHITLIIPEDRRDEETEIINRIKRGERLEHFETIRRRKDGTLVDVALTVSPVKDAFGRIVGASKVARDITERKKAELDRQRFITLADRCTEFIGMCDMEYQPFYLNEAALRTVGLNSPDDLRSIKVSDFFFPEDRIFLETEFLPKVLREGRGDIEIRFRHFKTGEAIWMIYNVFVIRDRAGKEIALATFSQNITNRKEIENALRKSEEQLRSLSNELEAKVRSRTAELEERNAEILQQSEQLRELSKRLLIAQDEERRRIARELHDSAGQLVAALGMTISGFSAYAKQEPAFASTLQNTEDLLQQLTAEIRTTSYLLHPPLLDENGLRLALALYLQGLRERSNLDIDFQISENFGRLPANLELALFRIVQESLTNVHRHSGSKTATIHITRNADSVSMVIRDYGKGISNEKLTAIRAQRAGVGVTGMRERMRPFRGVMDIQSDGTGVTVSITVPVSPGSTEREPETSPQRQAAG